LVSEKSKTNHARSCAFPGFHIASCLLSGLWCLLRREDYKVPLLAELKIYLERQNRDTKETKKGVRWAVLSANGVVLCCRNVI